MKARGLAVKRLFRAATVGVALACPVAGCSEIGFPAVHDMPAPRADVPLTADQVKQATDDLISERNHLNTEAQGGGLPGAPGSTATLVPQKTSLQPAGTAPADGTRTAGAGARP